MIDWLSVVNRTRYVSIVNPIPSRLSKYLTAPTTVHGREIYIMHTGGKAIVDLIDGDSTARLTVNGPHVYTLLCGVGEFNSGNHPRLRDITGEYCHQRELVLKVCQSSTTRVDTPMLLFLIEVVCCTVNGIRFYDIELCWLRGKLSIEHIHDRTSTPDTRYALTNAGYYSITLTGNRFRVELDGREIADDVFPTSSSNPHCVLDSIAMYTPRGIILRFAEVLVNIQPNGYTIFNTSPRYHLCGGLYTTGNYVELIKSDKVLLYNLETKKKKSWKLPFRMVPIGYDEDYEMLILSTNDSIVGLVDGVVVPLHTFSEHHPRYISYTADLTNHTITIRNVINRLPMCTITIVPDEW